MIGKSHFAERARPQFSRYSQQNRLFLINPAPMNKNQGVVGGNKVTYHIAIRPIIRRHHDAHVASAVDRLDSAKIQTFSHDLMESLPCQECNDIFFRAIIIVCLNGQLPEKSEWKENCQKQLKRGRKAHVSHPGGSNPALESGSWRR